MNLDEDAPRGSRESHFMKKGVYIVPSLFTLSNLGAGVISILFSATDHYTSAAWAIIAGIVMDMMDGRVARWTGATSRFGLELDSLSDLVTFGVAPGILMFQVALWEMGRPGYALVVLFAVAAALRLARFNLRAQAGDSSHYFLGLPVPAAAGILASFVLSYELFGEETMTIKTIPLVMKRMPMFFHAIPLVMMMLAFLMISPVHYGTFKHMKLGRPKSLQNFFLLVAGLLLIFTYPQNMIFVVFSLYVLSGLIGLAWRLYHAERAKRLARLRRRSTDVGYEAEEPRTYLENSTWNLKK